LYEAAERIAQCIQEPMEVAGQSLTMSVSVGLSIWPLHGCAFDDLLKRCDSALYEAQAAGGNRFKVFSEEDHAARTDQFRKMNDLRVALDRDQLSLYYQPLHNSATGELSGMEALIRWQHPEFGMIYPADFIPLAEESELILDIGYWVLDRVVEDLLWLKTEGYPKLPIALNISPRQFNHPGFASHINYYLKNHDIDASLLHLEITEDSLIDNMEQTLEALELLQTIGVQVYVDDFGVGYSSLNYIRSLPIHGLKIDKSFVLNIGRTTQDEAVVGTIVRLAHNLRLDIVAEGVETDFQRQFLRNLGCNHLQGHLFSEPIPKHVLIDYLASSNSAAVG
jgi:EAL domain-containing protein (putative c-di-GMP-specific phosphodiesterase class I)